jgi:hypothetical protein
MSQSGGSDVRTKALVAAATLVLVIAAVAVCAEIQLTPQTKAYLADAEEARERLGEEDGFVRALGVFDLALRMETTEAVSTAELRAFLRAQARECDAREEALVEGALEGAAERLEDAGFPVPLPERIAFVKTSGREEQNAAYTRGAAVFLPEAFLRMPEERMEGIIVHELFHVLSNCDGELRRRLYATLGFTRCGPIELPEIVKRRLYTNPDAYQNDYCVQVEYKGREVTVTPILMSPFRDYDPEMGRGWAAYIAFRLLVLKEENGRLVPSLEDGRPQLLTLGACPSYQERIGRNTSYIPQPEEVLAENFRMLVYGEEGLKDPKIPEHMREVFRAYVEERRQ